MGMTNPRKKSGSGSDIMAEINIVPLCDIFLVLLIIFMVTSVAMVQSGAEINLPEVQETESEPRQIVITVTPQKEIFVNARPGDHGRPLRWPFGSRSRPSRTCRLSSKGIRTSF